ncbi:MAG TPA: PAS domain-containing protein, partial [Phototrophicaceae bacterium]|nr:PAS domain-containing protein [Phototrophicaceae bacterium]
ITERRLEEDELRLSESRYRMICDLLGDYAYVFRIKPDNTSVLEWVSAGFTRVTGYTLAEFQEFDGWQLGVYPDELELMFHRLKSLLSGKSITSEFRFVTKDGDIVWVRDSAKPIWDDNEGRVTAIYGVAQVVTDERQVNQPESQHDDLLRYDISDERISLCAVNRDGVFSSVEGHGLDVLGLKQEKLIGRSIYEVYGEHPDLLREFHRAFLGDSFSHNSQIQNKTFSAQYTPIYNPQQEISGVLIVFTYSNLTN